MHQTVPAFLQDFLQTTLSSLTPECPEGAISGSLSWKWLGHGAILFYRTNIQSSTNSYIISSGIHGNETAPIEICNQLIQEIAQESISIQGNILFLFGNIEAMRQNKRFIDDDLNRLFSGKHHEMPQSKETMRALEIENIIQRFINDSSQSSETTFVHLDMHTAIRGSFYKRFAIAPFKIGPMLSKTLVNWMGNAGIEAVLLNAKPAGTFSYFTSQLINADALTLELGKALPFGENNLEAFSSVTLAIRQLISGGEIPVASMTPKVFKIINELERKTDSEFRLLIDDEVENFTAYPKGTILATDKDYQYCVTHEEERVVFPNRHVKPGLRAGLMVIESDIEPHIAS